MAAEKQKYTQTQYKKEDSGLRQPTIQVWQESLPEENMFSLQLLMLEVIVILNLKFAGNIDPWCTTTSS